MRATFFCFCGNPQWRDRPHSPSVHTVLVWSNRACEKIRATQTRYVQTLVPGSSSCYGSRRGFSFSTLPRLHLSIPVHRSQQRRYCRSRKTAPLNGHRLKSCRPARPPAALCTSLLDPLPLGRRSCRLFRGSPSLESAAEAPVSSLCRPIRAFTFSTTSSFPTPRLKPTFSW